MALWPDAAIVTKTSPSRRYDAVPLNGEAVGRFDNPGRVAVAQLGQLQRQAIIRIKYPRVT